MPARSARVGPRARGLGRLLAGRLYAVDVETGATHALTPFVGALFAQGLSRDGRTVLAAIGCGGILSPFGLIETIPFTGGRPTVVVRGRCRASSNF